MLAFLSLAIGSAETGKISQLRAFLTNHSSLPTSSQSSTAVSVALQSNTSSVFAAWAAFNGKAYSAEDLQARLPIFTANVARQISRLGLYSGFTEVNGLADISTKEFKATHLGHVSKSIVAELGCAQGMQQTSISAQLLPTLTLLSKTALCIHLLGHSIMALCNTHAGLALCVHNAPCDSPIISEVLCHL